MKISIKAISMLVLATGAIFTGCKKYEEGPAINLIPKKERVANTWIVEKAIESGKDATVDFNQYELYLTVSGDAELQADYTAFGVKFTDETNGTWEFTNEQENLKFDYEENSQDAEYQILKLTQTELWLRKIGKDLEIHLKEK